MPDTCKRTEKLEPSCQVFTNHFRCTTFRDYLSQNPSVIDGEIIGKFKIVDTLEGNIEKDLSHFTFTADRNVSLKMLLYNLRAKL